MDAVQMRLPEGVNEHNATLPPQLLVTAKQAAWMCGKSLRTWRAWDSAGWIPRPVRIGRSTLWRADVRLSQAGRAILPARGWKRPPATAWRALAPRRGV